MRATKATLQNRGDHACCSLQNNMYKQQEHEEIPSIVGSVCALMTTATPKRNFSEEPKRSSTKLP